MTGTTRTRSRPAARRSSRDRVEPGERRVRDRASGSATTASASRPHSRRASRRWLGRPNRISGAPSGWLSKWPSIAMTLAGWCSSVLRPCASPATIWIGATSAAIHIAIENAVRALRRRRGRLSRCHAPTAADDQRGRQIGGDDGVDQAIGEAGVEDDRPPAPAGTNWPCALIAQPAGVCIQLLTDRIQNAEIEGADRDHAGRGEVQPLPDLASSRTA